MTDWAYKLADSLKLPLGTRNTEKIAAALREARAAGWRDATEFYKLPDDPLKHKITFLPSP